MMDSGYSETPVAKPEAKPAEAESEDTEESVDEENAGAPEILITKSKLPGKKEGDTCTFKVVKDFGDELSLEYVKSEQTKDTMSADTESEIAALDTKE